MLNRAAFATEMHHLADRFNRQVSDEMVRRYHEDLQELDTPNFLKAARAIYKHDTFWPPPARFLEVAGVDPKSRAETAWEHALDEAKKGIGKPYSEYGAAHGHALKSVGGSRTIGETKNDQLPFVKRDFISAYKTHAERQGNLPELEKPGVPTLPNGIAQKVLNRG